MERNYGMKRIKYIVFSIAILFCLHIAIKSHSEPPTYYLYLSDIERSRFNEIIWFWTPDTLDGPVRSNDYIGFKYRPHVFDYIWTAQEDFVYSNANPYFRYEPHFKAPPYPFYESYPHIIENAEVSIDAGRYMMRVRLAEDDGVNIYRYPLGGESLPLQEEDSLFMNVNLDSSDIIYIDGQAEVYGTLEGRLTLYTTQNMWLMDNILYSGVSEENASFDEEDTDDMLGLVSERNIIIKDNEYNGRADGWIEYEFDETDKHSIAVNGSLIALDEWITFEHHNDDWEAFQGPTPDERGKFHLKGGLAFKRRDYFYRSNHIGTGYQKRWRYDQRLRNEAPPGFEDGCYPDINGVYDRMVLPTNREADADYNVWAATVNTLRAEESVVMKLKGLNSILVRDSLVMSGNPRNRVKVRTGNGHPAAGMMFYAPVSGYVSLENVNFERNVKLEIHAAEISMRNCRFQGEVIAYGRSTIDNCWFDGKLTVSSYGDVSITRNLLKGGMEISGSRLQGEIHNNTFVTADRAGIRINDFEELDIRNNIIAGNRYGIRNRSDDNPALEYNDVYLNRYEDYEDCEAGEGSISEDPVFWSERGNYELKSESPCIDAGDPNSPRDPDGTLADMGAFYYDQELIVGNAELAPAEFTVIAYPNPFNKNLKIKFVTALTEKVDVYLYNTVGRQVLYSPHVLSPGTNTIYLDSQNLPASGVYFLNIVSGSTTKSIKTVYLP